MSALKASKAALATDYIFFVRFSLATLRTYGTLHSNLLSACDSDCPTPIQIQIQIQIHIPIPSTILALGLDLGPTKVSFVYGPGRAPCKIWLNGFILYILYRSVVSSP